MPFSRAWARGIIFTASGASPLIKASMGWVTVSGAGPPLAGENLMPLYSEGLWLAVIDGPGALAFPDGETYHRRGAIPGGEMAGDAVAGHHLRGGSGKGLGPEAGVVADHHAPLGEACLFQIVGNGLAHQAGVGEGEIFRQNAPPTRGPEFDFRHLRQFLFMQRSGLGVGVRDQGSVNATPPGDGGKIYRQSFPAPDP